MNKLHRFYVVLIVLQLALPRIGAICFGQVRDTTMPGASNNIYAIQIAASKVYIDPEFFRQKYHLTEEIRYFLKDGWYKYLIGSYKTEAGAATRLAALKFEAFVTAISEKGVSKEATVEPGSKMPPADSLPESKANSADSSQLSQKELLRPVINESELRRLYNYKIREADSAFNLARNLLVARQLYQDASLIEEDKNYPKDQIIEIDKLLTQKQSRSIFSGLHVRFYIIAGFAFMLLLVAGTTMMLLSRNKKRLHPKREGEEEIQEPVKRIDFKQPGGQQMDFRREKYQEPGQVHDEIVKYLNSSDEFLRIEAELALIRLNTNDPLSFLDQLKREFTPLEQLLVFEKIKRSESAIPDFSRWLNSPNLSVILFSKRMMRAFKQGNGFSMGEVNVAHEKKLIENKGTDRMVGKPDEDFQEVALRILNLRIQQ